MIFVSHGCEKFGEEFVLPPGKVEFAPQRHAGSILLHQVEGHVAENGEVISSVIATVSRLVLVHDGIENPVQAVFDAPMQADDLAQAFGREGLADEIIGGLDRLLRGGAARTDHLADSSQSRPAVTLLQLLDFGAHEAGALLDTAVVTVYGRVPLGALIPRLVQQLADLGMQPPMVALERQCVPSTLATICWAISRRQLSASA